MDSVISMWKQLAENSKLSCNATSSQTIISGDNKTDSALSPMRYYFVGYGMECRLVAREGSGHSHGPDIARGSATDRRL